MPSRCIIKYTLCCCLGVALLAPDHPYLELLLLDDPPSVANNDECWGAYFASCDKRFVDKLVETTRHASSSSNPNLMLAADTAKWSLASNAEQHPLVWGAIESAVACGREDLQELLTEEPEVFLARMRDTYKAIDAPNGEA